MANRKGIEDRGVRLVKDLKVSEVFKVVFSTEHCQWGGIMNETLLAFLHLCFVFTKKR